jgi:23S rRNA (cytosine1962-C5)-methyltransferase
MTMAAPRQTRLHATVPRLRLRVTAAAERTLRAGHPWLFADSVVEQNRTGELGELGIVYDQKNRFLAAGLFDPSSPIRLRVLQKGKPMAIDRHWWQARLDKALDCRRGLFNSQTTGFRWINGESDGWPALVLDRYDKALVLKLYSAIWLPQLAMIVDLLQEVLSPERIVLRLSRNVQDLAAHQFAKHDGMVLQGPALAGPVPFRESGLSFEADVLRGQKTGFFLDQRENRRAVEELASGRAVLNAFSFSGGFSVYAARGEAAEVTDLDLSAHALATAKRNFNLNKTRFAIQSCGHSVVQADAFEWLAGNRRRKFGLIILDPPSFAKRESERAGALRAYQRLAELAMSHLSDGGILLACSCSAHVSAGEFREAVCRGVRQAGRQFEVLQTTAHAPDHPATFPEANYLKAVYLRLV